MVPAVSPPLKARFNRSASPGGESRPLVPEMSTSMQHGATPRRILIVRPSALGDVCRTVPVLASLKRAWPQSTIDWLVQDDLAPAIEAHPALHAVIHFPRRQFGRSWYNPATTIELWRWLGRLRQTRYDLVLDCQGLGRSGLFTWMTRAPGRIGLATARELAWIGYTRRITPPMAPHTVDHMLALVSAVDVEPISDMQLYIMVDHARAWASQADALGLIGTRYAVLAPTARWLSKRWPIERWKSLIPQLLDRGFERIVVIGAPGEEDQVAAIQSTSGDVPPDVVINLVGQTSIGQTMAAIADASLVIANDSAPLHMAVGFDRPLVALFGPTDPAFVGPYRRDEAVVRNYTPRAGETVHFKDARLGDSLMRLIEVDDVLACVDAQVQHAAAVGDEASR